MTEQSSEPRRSLPARVLRWLGWGLAGLVGLFVTGAAVGAVYQAFGAASDREEFPPPGELVDIGGYRLHIQCMGQGSPAVILDSGAMMFSSGWWWVQRRLASTTRVCAYDRAGMGWSDPGPEPYDGLQAVRELHALIEAAGIERPFVFAGHSLGAILGRIYYTQYPDDLAGLVMVGPADPDILLGELGKTGEEAIKPCSMNCTIAPWAARLGLVRAFLAYQEFSDDPEFPPRAVAEIKARFARPEAMMFAASMGRYVPRMILQTKANTTLGDLPVAIVYSGELGSLLGDSETKEDEIADREQSVEAFGRTVALSSRGTGPHKIPGANHLSVIAYDKHAAEVAGHVAAMVLELRRAAAPDPEQSQEKESSDEQT